jgi:hypothetical protein
MGTGNPKEFSPFAHLDAFPAAMSRIGCGPSDFQCPSEGPRPALIGRKDE